MADQKLSPSLFCAKAGIAQPNGSTRYLHFVASIRLDRNRYSFVCERQPLMTFGSHGLPRRCPVCGTPNPLKENSNVDHEKQ